jgi:hypothetical protein
MRRSALAIVAVAAAALTAGCSSGPSHPSWCGPLITQFHAKVTAQAYQSGLAAIERQGAPVRQLAADDAAYDKDRAVMDDPNSGTAGYNAVFDAQKKLEKVEADLKSLNATCGQPSDAWQKDDV